MKVYLVNSVDPKLFPDESSNCCLLVVHFGKTLR